jgi:cytochrome c oxidase cbb3-type subunit 3
MSDKKVEIDNVTNVETTGHEWDGIKELNNPAPRWWLWVFFISVIWSLAYWVVYPAWPTLSGEGHRGGTEGLLKDNQYVSLVKSREEIMQRRSQYLERFKEASFDEILNDDELYAFAMRGGAAAFKDNCATCHGTGGAGSPGYPNLNDDDWIWGGSLEEIYQTVRYGIRNENEDSHYSVMPPFADMLKAEDQEAVAEYVHGLSSGEADQAGHGAVIFREQCATCHGEDGKGLREFGAPNLADAIWLKSTDGSVHAILQQIRNPKHGVMPAWEERLDPQTVRQLTIYVHSLGGGE